MDLQKAQIIADDITKKLSPYCSKIEVAGSIRRKKPVVRDIDIVLIPSDAWNLHRAISELGTVKA